MNVTFRFCWFTPSNSLKLPVFKGFFTDLGSHSFLHISFYPLYLLRIDDSFMKYVITGDLIKKYQNDDGIVFMNVFDFLLDKDSI